MKVQELKDQVDELAKQNQTVLDEIAQLKDILQKASAGSNGGGNQGQSANSGTGGDQGQQGNSNNASQGSSGSTGAKQVPQLANELVKIKDMITQLETKTSQFVSGQSNGNLKEEDVVNLVLILMDGMIDWASDFVKKSGAGGQGGGSGNQDSGSASSATSQ